MSKPCFEHTAQSPVQAGDCSNAGATSTAGGSSAEQAEEVERRNVPGGSNTTPELASDATGLYNTLGSHAHNHVEEAHVFHIFILNRSLPLVLPCLTAMSICCMGKATPSDLLHAWFCFRLLCCRLLSRHHSLASASKDEALCCAIIPAD